MRSINPVLFITSIALLLLVNRLYSVSLPNQFYFSFSSFLLDNRELSKLPALAAKLSQPFLASLVLMALLQRSALYQRSITGKDGSLTEVVKHQAPLTLAYGAGFTALLLAWPYILLWDVLVDPSLAPFRALYLLSYMAYVVGFSFFALSGAEVAKAILEALSSDGFSLNSLSRSELLKPVFTAISGIVATAISTFLAGQVG